MYNLGGAISHAPHFQPLLRLLSGVVLTMPPNQTGLNKPNTDMHTNQT